MSEPDEAVPPSDQPAGEDAAIPSVDPVKSETGGEPIDYGKAL